MQSCTVIRLKNQVIGSEMALRRNSGFIMYHFMTPGIWNCSKGPGRNVSLCCHKACLHTTWLTPSVEQMSDVRMCTETLLLLEIGAVGEVSLLLYRTLKRAFPRMYGIRLSE